MQKSSQEMKVQAGDPTLSIIVQQYSIRCMQVSAKGISTMLRWRCTISPVFFKHKVRGTEWRWPRVRQQRFATRQYRCRCQLFLCSAMVEPLIALCVRGVCYYIAASRHCRGTEVSTISSKKQHVGTSQRGTMLYDQCLYMNARASCNHTHLHSVSSKKNNDEI